MNTIKKGIYAASMLFLFSAMHTMAEVKRTVVFIKGQTIVGQDMYLRGGVDHAFAKNNLGKLCTSTNFLCSVPITHNGVLAQNSSRVNDKFLDWYGAEVGQGNVQGSLLVWTTNNANNAHKVVVNGFGFDSENHWGDHYWKLDVMMDCAKTATPDGWFELKSFISNGPGWEPNIQQAGTPYISGNHFAKCGFMNKFERGSNKAEITSLVASPPPIGCSSSTMWLMSSGRNFGADPTTGLPGTLEQRQDNNVGLRMFCNNQNMWEATEMFVGSGAVFDAGSFQFASTLTFKNVLGGVEGEPFFAGASHNTAPGTPRNNIVIRDESPPQGTYRITLDESTNPKTYRADQLGVTCSSQSMKVRGDFNNWGSQDLFCVGTNQWAGIVMFIKPNGVFKFDTLGDWSQSWGDNAPKDGLLEIGGENLVVNDPGRYFVLFDRNALQYTIRKVSRACGNPSMKIRITNTASLEDGEHDMECENGHWAYEIDNANSGVTSVQFDPSGTGAWYGDTAPRTLDGFLAGELDKSANAITFNNAGHFHIHVYDNDTNEDVLDNLNSGVRRKPSKTNPSYKLCSKDCTF